MFHTVVSTEDLAQQAGPDYLGGRAGGRWGMTNVNFWLEAYGLSRSMQEHSRHKELQAWIQAEVVTVQAFSGSSMSSEGQCHQGHGNGE